MERVKLAAIYNVWDGVELLKGSMESVVNGVDLFVIVWQHTSNYGEEFNPRPWIPAHIYRTNESGDEVPIYFVEHRSQSRNPRKEETTKRSVGLHVAIECGATHFLHMDCDEFYTDFVKLKQRVLDLDLDGSVCQLQTYFKKPTLQLQGFDNYYVPFIHKIQPGIDIGVGIYPFYVDPTRKVKMDQNARVDVVGVMHHFSYVRADIERKARNSTAAGNIAKSQLLKQYHNPDTGPGTKIVDFQNKELVEVPDIFRIEKQIKDFTANQK